MIRIRSCLPEDEKVVFTLARDFATSFPVDQVGFSQTFSHVLAAHGMYFAVAESENAVVGYVLGTAHPTFYASGHVAWVEEIMVKEDFRRQGVGKLLMENFESWAKSKDCRLIALATRRAAEFYKSLGYAESATYFRKVVPTSSSSKSSTVA
ncbi:MAG: GNAT family N-acetyltransferase [Methylacidiphilales bacterium]|nr:GNAT family N-acetyltransferase [Candidatus Methylacidiphilales bacterium]